MASQPNPVSLSAIQPINNWHITIIITFIIIFADPYMTTESSLLLMEHLTPSEIYRHCKYLLFIDLLEHMYYLAAVWVVYAILGPRVGGMPLIGLQSRWYAPYWAQILVEHSLLVPSMAGVPLKKSQ